MLIMLNIVYNNIDYIEFMLFLWCFYVLLNFIVMSNFVYCLFYSSRTSAYEEFCGVFKSFDDARQSMYYNDYIIKLIRRHYIWNLCIYEVFDKKTSIGFFYIRKMLFRDFYK